ncbi:MAG: hypothetical protein JW749_00305 [Sedimentisphaerales bacterium]|nr:hypothetical protein [Sedimentisphaerales bacterium]
MMMRNLLVTIALTASILVFSASAGAVDSRPIEAVRAKKVLDGSDLKVIDDFLSQAITEVLNASDFSSISNIRAIIVANSPSAVSGQVQFADQFSESAKKHVGDALLQADGLTPPKRSFVIVTNLLMLLDDLADPRLVELPLKYAGDKNSVISYLAVHCLTNPEIVKKLNAEKEPDTARQIAASLDDIIATSPPETLGLIASFAGSVKINEGIDLLLKVADKRIASYAGWSVKFELLDAAILQQLADKMVSSPSEQASAGRRFGQLFSYVCQRYIKGNKILNKTQKEQLVSVLLETEKNCLTKFIKKPSFAFKKAIEAGDLNALLAEHNNLLGDTTKQGILPAELNFDYGRDNNGSQLTHPVELAAAPQALNTPPAAGS